jgi:hypothetical protein
MKSLITVGKYLVLALIYLNLLELSFTLINTNDTLINIIGVIILVLCSTFVYLILTNKLFNNKNKKQNETIK